MSLDKRVKALAKKGVEILHPGSVFIGEEVDLDRISGKGVVLHPGCRIRGDRTLIMEGTVIGSEAPATVEDCQIGPRVELKGGFFRRSVFLEGANVASGAHVREACILEEQASCAHSVGLKQTILMPFVTLGSLVNFCDCLMAGGTGRKDHSEVGSSYIHFNFTPNQDKATASLIGDVPRGVMLRERPIFLGGQGGLVGPAVVEYGTVIAAGTVFRGDVPEGGKLVTGVDVTAVQKDFIPGLYPDIRRRIRNNIAYMANLVALKAWYTHVRCMFMERILLEGALDKLDMALEERMTRLKGFTEKLSSSQEPMQRELSDRWQAVDACLRSYLTYAGDDGRQEEFLAGLTSDAEGAGSYLDAIRMLSGSSCTKGTTWLAGIVRKVNDAVFEMVPSFR